MKAYLYITKEAKFLTGLKDVRAKFFYSIVFKKFYCGQIMIYFFQK